jgi:hypothetical protein
MDSQLLLESLTRLKETWPSPPWSWDARFATVAASFTIDLEPAVRQSARLAFPRGWTLKSLPNAPDAFRELADRTGMRANQRLLGGDEMFASELFGLWWPWGGGDKVTLRIGILGLDAKTEPVPSIRALFGA